MESNLDLETIVRQFCTQYKMGVDARAFCAKLYADYLAQFSDGLDHTFEFRHAVAKICGAYKFRISGHYWRLLYRVGKGDILEEFLCLGDRAAVGLELWALKVPVLVQRKLVSEGYDIIHGEEVIHRNYTDPKMTVRELRLLFVPDSGGTMRTPEEQRSYLLELATHMSAKDIAKAQLVSRIKSTLTSEELWDIFNEMEDGADDRVQ